jgi:hypothetical protein
MGGSRRVIAAGIALLVLMGAGCSGSDDGDEGSGGDGNGESTTVDFGALDAVFEPIPPGGGDNWRSFRDDFTAPSSSLESFTRDDTSGTAVDGGYELAVPQADDFIAISTNAGNSSRVTVQAEVGSTGSATDAGYGVVCLRDDGGNFFYGGVGNDGTYAIGRVSDGTREVLTNDGEWAASDVVEAGLDEYRVRLDCVNDGSGDGETVTLTLTVDGETVDSVQSADMRGFDAGIFLQTFEEPDAVATFSSFLVATGGTVGNDSDFGSHDYHQLVLNQPSTVGSCEVSEPKYYHTRFPASFVVGCGSESYLPGASTAFFVYRDDSDSPETPVQQARATYRDLLERVGLEPHGRGDVPPCGRPGARQGALIGLAEDDTIVTEGAIACGQARDGRNFVVSWIRDDRGAVVAISQVPRSQRGPFAQGFDRDFPGIPTGGDSIAFDGVL